MDGVVAYLFKEEAKVFEDIAMDLRAILETPALGEDPVRERLFPRAYLDPTEETAEMAWAAFAHPELMESRVQVLMNIVESLNRLELASGELGLQNMHFVVLEPQETESWLKGINDLRLALGTRLNISDETEQKIDPFDPHSNLHEIYNWLTALQQDLLEQVYLS